MSARVTLLDGRVTRLMAVAPVLVLVLVLVLVSGLIGGLRAQEREGAEPVPPAAARTDIFTITGVKVDVTAQSANAARNQALAEGQRTAFDMLMRRLLRQEDRAALPPIEPLALNALIQGIEIGQERSSSVRYLAELTVRFNPARVRNYLETRDLPFSQTAGRPVLVVPVMETAGLRLLWEDDNPWRAAWEQHDLQNRLLTFLLPKGDRDDSYMVPPSQALDPESPALDLLASRYGVERVITPVIEITRDFIGGGLKARLRVIGADDRFDPIDGEFALAAPEEVAPEDAEAEQAAEPEIMADGDRVTPEMLAPVVEAVVAGLDDQWKEQTLIRLDESGEMELIVPLRTAADWPEVGRRLAQVTLVQGRELRSLRPGEAVILVKYVGTRERVALGLAQASLVLEEREGREYLLLQEIAQDLGIGLPRAGGRSLEVPVPSEMPPGDRQDETE